MDTPPGSAGGYLQHEIPDQYLIHFIKLIFRTSAKIIRAKTGKIHLIQLAGELPLSARCSSRTILGVMNISSSSCFFSSFFVPNKNPSTGIFAK